MPGIAGQVSHDCLGAERRQRGGLLRVARQCRYLHATRQRLPCEFAADITGAKNHQALSAKKSVCIIGHRG
jgi:hypothetical protein